MASTADGSSDVAPAAPSDAPEIDPQMYFIKGLRIAVQGCGHGMLDQIYATIEQACLINNYTVDLLIICGDFQAMRNSRDLLTMACPVKYRHMCDFYKYYNGSKTAPVPTLFIGGNHEASAHLYEITLGGWAAPNIYYMGTTGVVNVNGIRIAGVSGIYNHTSYMRPRTEKPPYDRSSVRSAYHYRSHELFKLNMLSGDVDIFLSHDWPEGITKYGDERGLLSVKKHFKPDIDRGELGSKPLMGLLRTLRPKYWFSGHMHVKFPAVVDHGQVGEPKWSQALEDERKMDWTAEMAKNEDEIDLDLDDDATSKSDDKGKAPAAAPSSSAIPNANTVELPTITDPFGSSAVYPLPATTNTRTHFLALDKLLPNRDYLQILPITSRSPQPLSSPTRVSITHDREWLAILRVLEPLDVATGLGLSNYQKLAKNTAQLQKLIRKELEWVNENITDEQLIVPADTWERTSKLQWDDHTKASKQPEGFDNPQTRKFCEMLGIESKWTGTTEIDDAESEQGVEGEGEGAGEEEDGGRGGNWGSQRGRGGRGRGGGGWRGRGGRDRGGGGGRGFNSRGGDLSYQFNPGGGGDDAGF